MALLISLTRHYLRYSVTQEETILLLLLWKLDDIWQLKGCGLDSSSCQILINDLLDNASHPLQDKLAKHRTAFKEFFHPTRDRAPQEVIPACGHQMFELCPLSVRHSEPIDSPHQCWVLVDIHISYTDALFHIFYQMFLL